MKVRAKDLCIQNAKIENYTLYDRTAQMLTWMKTTVKSLEVGLINVVNDKELYSHLIIWPETLKRPGGMSHFFKPFSKPSYACGIKKIQINFHN